MTTTNYEVELRNAAERLHTILFRLGLKYVGEDESPSVEALVKAGRDIVEQGLRERSDWVARGYLKAIFDWDEDTKEFASEVVSVEFVFSLDTAVVAVRRRDE